jgi:hypothetical protein
VSNLTWTSETMLLCGCYRRRFPTPKVPLSNVGRGSIVGDLGDEGVRSAHRQHKVIENKPFWRSTRLRFWTVKIAWGRDTGKNETSSTPSSVERSPPSPPRIPGLTQGIRDPNSAYSFPLSNSEFPESQECKDTRRVH